MAIETSYEHEWGSGNRVGEILVNSNFQGASALQNTIDGSNGTRMDTLSSNANNNSFITWKFTKPVIISEFKILASTANQFEVQVLTKNSVWVVVKNSFNTPNNAWVTIGFEPVEIVELKLVKKPSSDNYIWINEIEFKLAYKNHKVLIKKDSQYGYYTDSFQSLGTTYPTKEQFEQYGMSDLSMLEAGDVTVEYEMELISETDKEKIFSYTFDLNGQHKDMKSIDGITIK